MIFVTTSKGLFFKRMIKAIDTLSEKYSLYMIVQGGYEYHPESEKIKYYTTLPRDEFERYFDQADLVISHAGIGNIIMGKQKCKPLIIVPRLKKFGEHHNDHQLEIAKKLEGQRGFKVIYNVDELDSMEVLSFSEKPAKEDVEGKKAIIQEVRAFCSNVLQQ